MKIVTTLLFASCHSGQGQPDIAGTGDDLALKWKGRQGHARALRRRPARDTHEVGNSAPTIATVNLANAGIMTWGAGGDAAR